MVWLDMMYLFPLFLLSLHHLAKTGSLAPYAFCLAAMITVNFYLGYMVVLFLILAARIWVFFFSPHTIRGERIIQLAAGTLGAALLSAVVWAAGAFTISKFCPRRKPVPKSGQRSAL